MSRIRHACAKCNHERTEHSRAGGHYTSCQCCTSSGERTAGGPTWDGSDDPALIETFDARTLRREDRFWAPGEEYNAGNVHRHTLCACAKCLALAEQAS